jgi:putative ABC transport system substrate-binding protein
MKLMFGRRWTASIGAFVLLSLAAAASAQRSGPARRIGFLGMDSKLQAQLVAGFRDEMRKQGYIEGGNLVIEYRWAEAHFERLPALAAELVAQKVEVIVTVAPPPVRAAQKATTTIPIVMITSVADAMGFAVTLAHPGGNITGIAVQDSELAAKRLDLLRSVVPNLTRVAILYAAGEPEAISAVEGAARALAIATKVYEVHEPSDISAAVVDAKAWGAQGLVQLTSPVFGLHRKILLDSLAANRMPAVCERRVQVEEGCLMTYSTDLGAQFRGLASFTVQILKGAKPSDLPIEQPREFEFVVNLRTAKALGVTIPPAVQLQLTDAIK